MRHKVNQGLNFNGHASCLEQQQQQQKTSQKINTPRMTSIINFEQRGLIMNAFINSHFSYFPVVWMFRSQKIK